MRTAQRSILLGACAAALTLSLAACVQSPQVTEEPAAASEESAAGESRASLAGAVALAAGLTPQICNTVTVEGPTSPCPSYQQKELCQPIEIAASGGVLSTQLDVAKRWQCVPELADGSWQVKPKLVRNYGYIDQRGTGRYGFPGPTFRMSRASANPTVAGDRFKMLFTNSMGPTTVAEQMKCFAGADGRFSNDVAPNCFHGSEVTNFHFHGFHVSPQPLQDYVLLKLYPKDTPTITNYRPDMSNEELRHFTSIGGAYRYDVDPLPYNQPEGTHWYHAHHHGATALQVINGMAGTFIIDGPFDKWLNDHYGYEPDGTPKLKDRLFVVQQINDVLNTTTPLVNGQGNPIVSIRPGEVQRWRFVSATTQASAQLELSFGDLRVCQIQMDGVQFSPANYQRQPLLKFGSSPSEGTCGFDATFQLSPGNRADFLVKMPEPDFLLDREFPMMQKVIGGVGEQAQGEIDLQMSAMRQLLDPEDLQMSEEMIPLMTIRALDTVEAPMSFPLKLPPLPKFLTPPTPGAGKEIYYQMYSAAGSNPAPVFKIDDMQVRDCVPKKLTLTRGNDELWVVRNRWDDQPARKADADGNNRGIAHPFHIHTNPFYVYRNGKQVYSEGCQPNEVCGIWQDTIRLPLAADTDPDPELAASVALHMEFEDYTGGYVQHCHILGHEDRGMMTLVQTLCPGTREYGTPVANQPDNCGIPRTPLPVCPD